MLRVVLLVAMGSLALALVLRITVAGVFEDIRPVMALDWVPINATASADMSARLLAAGRIAEARHLALVALRRDPTRVVAVRTLGLAAEVEGHDSDARQLNFLASRLSRRDILTQIWLIRFALQRADYEGAIRHFDIAMRTSTTAADQLIPLLVAASADRNMLPPLARTLSRRPSWKVPFLLGLAAGGPEPAHTAFLSRYLDPQVQAEKEALAVVIDRLIVRQAFDLAWSVYRRLRPDIEAGAITGLRDGTFEGATDYPPLDWLLVNEPGLAALKERLPAVGGNALSLVADGQSGSVARQLVQLSVGRYSLEYDAGAVPNEATGRPTVSVRCATSDAVFYVLRPSQGQDGLQRVRGDFDIPASCRWQWIMVSIAGTETGEVPPWIARLAVRRRI